MKELHKKFPTNENFHFEKPKKAGRKPYFDDEAKRKLSNDIERRDLERNSFNKRDFHDHMESYYDDILRSKKLNPRGRAMNISRNTRSKYTNELLPRTVQQPTVQNEKRLEALKNPLNQISLASVFSAITTSGTGDIVDTIPPWLMINFDSTAVLCQSKSDDDNSIMLAANSIAKLKELRLSPGKTISRTAEVFKQRAAHVIPAITAEGAVNCVVIKIKDRRFMKVEISKLTDTNLLPYRIYLLLVPYRDKDFNYSESNSSIASNSRVIVAEDKLTENDKLDDLDRDFDEVESVDPSIDLRAATLAIDAIMHATTRNIEQHIENELKSHITRMAQRNSQESSEDAFSKFSDCEISRDDVNAEKNKLRAIICFDGELAQGKAIDKLIEFPNKYGIVYEYLKLPAQCSMISQPCDQAASFREFKRKVREYRRLGYFEEVAEPVYMNDPFLLSMLSKLDSASRRTYKLFLLQLPSFLSHAFTVEKVKQGWKSPGLYPYNPLKIIQKWSGFRDITELAGANILKEIPNLASIVRRNGFLTADDILSLVGDFITTANIPVTKQNLEDYQVHRWMATWLNNEGTIDRRKLNEQKVTDKASVKVDNKQKRLMNKKCSICEMRRSTVDDIWTNCKYKKCKFSCCPKCYEADAIELHMRCTHDNFVV